MKRFFRLAKKVAEGDDCRRYRLGAVGVRSDGATVVARNIPNRLPEPMAHAEARLSKKLDRGSIVYIVRIDRSGGLVMAKPCANCLRLLRSKKVKKIFYSINNKEYGCVIL